MNILEKFLTALRGGVHEAGERLADGQAMLILEQEMREADGQLQRAKDSLVELLAKQRLAESQAQTLVEKIQEYEGYAVQALDKGEEALAAEVAGKIAAWEAEKHDQEQLIAKYAHGVHNLQHMINETEGHLRRIRQQADTVKATERVQQAQEAVAERFGSPQSKMHTAMESLARIKEKQMEKAIQLDVRGELAAQAGETALDEKLHAAGIGKAQNDAQAVLARLKAQREGA